MIYFTILCFSIIFYSAAGTFQSLSGQSSCLVCPAGSVSQYVASLHGLVGPTVCIVWYDNVASLHGLVGPTVCTVWYDIRNTSIAIYCSDTSVL